VTVDLFFFCYKYYIVANNNVEFLGAFRAVWML